MNIFKRILRKTDRIFLTLMGQNIDTQKKFIVPDVASAAELRAYFIKDYVKAQPSFLQVILLGIYVKSRHFVGVNIRRLLGKQRETDI